MAIALPRLTAVAIFATRIRKAFITIFTPPTYATPALIGSLAVAVFGAATLPANGNLT